MVEIRFHGRGGQGTVVASQILAAACFREGKHVQAFPAFGVERRGAPVTAFLRLDDEPIRLRYEIYEPDHLVILDPTLLPVVDVTAGLRPGGWVLINSDRDPQAFEGLFRRAHGAEGHLRRAHERSPSPGAGAEEVGGVDTRLATVDAARIAVEHELGTRTHPIVNTALLGALARVSGLVSLEAIVQAIREEVPARPEANAAAARQAYEEVHIHVHVHVHVQDQDRAHRLLHR